MSTATWKRGDMVGIGDFATVGVVRRAAREGSWVDVWWLDENGTTWTKRQPHGDRLRAATEEEKFLLEFFHALSGLVADGIVEVSEEPT